MEARPGADPRRYRCAMDGGYTLTSNEHESRFYLLLVLCLFPLVGKPTPTMERLPIIHV